MTCLVTSVIARPPKASRKYQLAKNERAAMDWRIVISKRSTETRSQPGTFVWTALVLLGFSTVVSKVYPRPNSRPLAIEYRPIDGPFQRTRLMEKCNLDALQLVSASVDGDESATWWASFPFSPDAPGETIAESDSLTIVYNELEPGTRIGAHRDATDEALLLLTGTVEVEVDGRISRAEPNDLALIPARTCHSVTNVGSETARMIGCFGEGTLESEFEGTVVPDESRG